MSHNITFYDLSKDSIIKKAEGFDNLNPELSVILTTHARFKNGLFQASLKSVIEQTFKNLEIIIVDDGSNDGTENLIAEYMLQDSRICTIRHPKNVGYLTISINEALIIARGDKVAFCSDDTEVYLDGYEQLVNFMNANPDCHACYGQQTMLINGGSWIVGNHQITEDELEVSHCVGYGGVIIKKDVFNVVGLFDPHLLLVRFCDWDMWRRINEQYKWYFVDASISIEKGPLQDNSLGNTFMQLPFHLNAEYVGYYRNKELSFDQINNYKINNTRKNFSLELSLFLDKFLLTHFPQYRNNIEYDFINGGYILVICNSKDASTYNVFKNTTNFNIILISINELCFITPEILNGARVVILSRPFVYIHHPLLEVLTNRPYYVYYDDNVFELKSSYSNGQFYTMVNAKAHINLLCDAQGILTTNSKLSQFFEKYNTKTITLPVALAHELTDMYYDTTEKFNDNKKTIRIAFACFDKLKGIVHSLPSLKYLQTQTNCQIEMFIFVPEKQKNEYLHVIRKYSKAGFPVKILYSSGRLQIYNDLLSNKINFLIHPFDFTLTGSEIYTYKTLSFLNFASFADIVPIVIKRPPYDQIDHKNSFIDKCIINSYDEIGSAILSFLHNKQECMNTLTSIRHFMNDYYPEHKMADFIETVFNENISDFSTYTITNNTNNTTTNIVQTNIIIQNTNLEIIKLILKKNPITYKISMKMYKAFTFIKNKFKKV